MPPRRRARATKIALALLALGATAALAARAAAPTRPGPPALFEVVPVREGVWAAIARPVTPLNCNAAVIAGARELLVVDSHGTPSSAQSLLRQLARVTRLPVRYVVNTHFHGDHARGNQTYGPDVQIVATEATRRNLQAIETARLADELAALPARIAELRQDRSPAGRARLAAAERHRAELERLRIVLPTITFDRSLRLHGLGREVVILFLGRAHTDGDAVVYLPRERVVVTGDLVTRWGPGMGDGYPDEWLRTLDELARLDVETVIGGHGAVGGRELITNLRAYIADVIAEVKAELARGTPAAAVEKEVSARLVARHGDRFAPGELAPRVPGNVRKVLEDVTAGRY